MLNTRLLFPDYQQVISSRIEDLGRVNQNTNTKELSVTGFGVLSPTASSRWYSHNKYWAVLDFLTSNTLHGDGWVSFKELRARSISTYVVTELVKTTRADLAVIEKREGAGGKEYRVTRFGIAVLCYGVDRHRQQALYTQQAVIAAASKEDAHAATEIVTAFEDVCLEFGIGPSPEELRAYLAGAN